MNRPLSGEASAAGHRRRRRLRTVWIVVAVWTLFVALGAWWVAEDRLRDYREQSIATATVRLNAIKDTLAITFRQLAALPLNLAHRNAVSDYLAGSVPADARPAALQELNRTLDRASADFGLPLLSLIDRSGNVVVTTGTWRNAQPASEMNLATREYFTEAMAQGSAMQFLLGRASRQPGLYFANRVEQDGVAVGVAVVKQDADTVNRLLKDADGSRILISDANGVIVLGNQPDMLLKRLPGSPERPQTQWESVYQRVPETLSWQQSRLTDRGRTLLLTTFEGMRHLTLSSPLGDTAFRAWVIDPLDDEPRIAANAALGGLLIWAAGLLLIWLSWRRLQSLDEALQARREIYELAQALPLTVFRYHQPTRGRPSFSFLGRGVEELFGVDAVTIERDPELPWRIAGFGELPPTRPQEFLVRHGDEASWVLADSTPTLEPDGSTTYNGYWLDISLRRETQARFSAVFEHAASGYVFFDPARGISHVNAAALRLFGTGDPHQLLGRVLWYPDLSPELQPDGTSSRQRARADLREHTRNAQRVHHLEWRFARFDGSTFDAEVFVIALEWEGTPQFCAVIQDITARKQTEAAMREAREAAEAASRTKSSFLANMSHELRTPMNAIIGMTHLALEDGLPPKQRDYVEKAHGSARSLLQILNDILDVSKIEAGQMMLERIDFELESVVGEMADVLGLKADEKGLELLFSGTGDLPPRLVGDPSRLRQVLVNLGGNAIKFTERGEVVIGMEVASQDDEQIEIHAWVRDTGVGLSEDEIGRLFQPFAQADSSTTRRYGGTGLGLVISRQLVERMGGRLWVESEPGHGSTFHFTARFGRSTPRAPSRAWMANELRGRHALIVDDNAAALDVLGRMLEHLGVTVEKAVSGEQALQLVDAAPRRYTWILLDWKMPVMDGVTCARQIFERHADDHPCVLLVTAFSREDAIRAAGSLPLAGVLHKPVTPSNLHDGLVQARRRDEASAVAARRQIERGNGLSDAVRGRLAGARILLVEDHPLNQQLASELLRRAGMHVVLATDGREALQVLAERQVDGVLMDCQMPVMDGYAATRALREQPQWRELPVIAMTANALVGDRDKVLAAGMNDHVAKPIDVDQLFATLARWIRPAAAGPDEAPAIDRAAGIAATMGDEDLYRRLMRMFRDRETDFVRRFRAARAAGERAAAMRMAHDLKNVAGTLAVRGVHQAAAELERACIDEIDDAAIEPLLRKVERLLGPVMAELHALG